jgi:hypothetical protein
MSWDELINHLDFEVKNPNQLKKHWEEAEEICKETFPRTTSLTIGIIAYILRDNGTITDIHGLCKDINQQYNEYWGKFRDKHYSGLDVEAEFSDHYKKHLNSTFYNF